jgi:drug/metabolite transporter (DMT)-like permease
MPVLAFAGLALAVCIFTGGFASARLYMEAGGRPADVVALRYGVSGLLFVPFVYWARHRIAANPGWWRAAAIALGGGAPFGICVFIGVSGAPFTHGGGIVPGLAMVLGTLLAWRLLGETLDARRVGGICLTVVGLAWLLVPELTRTDVHWWGELAFFGAGICWACFTIMLRGFKVGPLEGTALAAFFSLPYLVVYVTMLEPTLLEIAWQDTLIHGFYQGVLFNMVAMGMYAWSVARVGAAGAVAAMPLMPAFAVVMEWAIFDRVAHDMALPAIGVMAIGIVLAAGMMQKTRDRSR